MNNNSEWMLRCVNYFNPDSVAGDIARSLLIEAETKKTKLSKQASVGGKGHFFKAVMAGDFLSAFDLADNTNKHALKEGVVYRLNKLDIPWSAPTEKTIVSFLLGGR